jgi:hypothetical protein
MSDIDEMYLNYLDSLDVDSVLTPDGYTINKKGYEIFGVNLEELEQGGEKVSSELKDMGIGMARGFTKLTEGVGSLGLAALEKLDLVSDGSVQKFGDFFAKEVYPRIGETEGLSGGLTEGVAQFLAPGVGYYKLFGAMMKVPKTASLLKKIITNVSKVTAAEAATVGTAQVAGDPNLVSFLDELFGIEPQLGKGIAKEMFTYLATPELGKDADSVLREKIKSIIADTPAAYLTEGLVLMTKIFKGFKQDPKIIENFDMDNPPPGVIEEPMPQRGDPDYEEPVVDPNEDIKQDLRDDISAQLEMDNK